MRTIAFVVLAGCYELPPPPVLPPHALSRAEPVDSTTAMLVVGGATDAGGSGLGMGVRVEYQDTDRTALGVELSGGKVSRGDIGGKGGGVSEPWHRLVGVRGYARYSTGPHTALTYGAGLSVLGTGLVTGILTGGAQATGANDDFDPVGAVTLALAVPLHDVRFTPTHDTYPYFRVGASPALYVRLDTGAIIPVGDTGNRLSLDFGQTFAVAFRDEADGDYFLDASFADSQRR
ncbi:MAG TPA: hypothetical protein VLX92_00940 [Kofleriaceae bacterium]|nr:hypothetical protein [Kofleriaceae bacterium]